jgi:dienelactone hydrolase
VTTGTPDQTDVLIPTPSDDVLHAWLYLPNAPHPAPAVVMGNGIGGVKAAGLAPFAERFAAEGLVALVFDYRH